MNNSVKSDPREPKRKRRSAEQARREILQAAQNRLMAEGPDGLRLKMIAKDVGISHSSILHHFGSRDGLLKALRDDAFNALARDLKKRLAEPSKGDPTVDFFEKVAATLGEEGYGRLLAWQIMSNHQPARAAIGNAVLGPDGSGGLLDGLAKMLHDMRIARARGRKEALPDLDETRTLVATCACTLIGEAIVGEVMVRSAGLGDAPESRKALRTWFAKQAEKMIFPYIPAAAHSQPSDAPSGSDQAGRDSDVRDLD